MSDSATIIIFCLGMALFLSLLMHYRDWMDRPNLNPGDRFPAPPPPDKRPHVLVTNEDKNYLRGLQSLRDGFQVNPKTEHLGEDAPPPPVCKKP